MPLSAPAVIDHFTGRYAFLSNFHRHPLTFEGEQYPTSEHAFNAAKTLDPDERARVQHAPSPAQAKAVGQTVTLRAHWDARERHTAMAGALAAKFTDPGLRTGLLSTGDALLIEGNTHCDQFWGDCVCSRHRQWPGHNHLGRALMALRSQLRRDTGDRWVRVAVTGHRPHLVTPAQATFGQSELARLAVKLRESHHTQVAISGLALGADTHWAAASAPAGLDLWAYCPFTAQADAWDEPDQRMWADLRKAAARVVTLGSAYDVKLLHARNDLMLRDADLIIAVTRPSLTTGGTASTVAKARAAGRPLITVNLDTLHTSLSAGAPGPA